jgi:hypothetical protein
MGELVVSAGYGVIMALCAFNPWFWGLPVLLVLAGVSSLANTSANAFRRRPSHHSCVAEP